MARKTLQGLSGIAETIARSGSTSSERTTPNPSNSPALGALQGSLTAIRELDPGVIDDWGPTDRLDEFTAVNSEDDSDGFEALKDSIQANGQQVPILVRRSATEGRYEAIYGRRRLKACRELGIKVRANVQDLDDATALLAKGLENAARRNLSFYERARFAQAIKTAGHDTQTVRQVLSLSASGLSHLTKVTDNIPNEIGDHIGSAPKSGRPKWTALAEAFLESKISKQSATQFLSKLGSDLSSDDRLELLLKEVTRRGARPQEGRVATPVEGVTIKSSTSSLAMTVKRAGRNAAFTQWLDENLETIIQKSYAEFTAVNSKDQK